MFAGCHDLEIEARYQKIYTNVYRVVCVIYVWWVCVHPSPLCLVVGAAILAEHGWIRLFPSRSRWNNGTIWLLCTLLFLGSTLSDSLLHLLVYSPLSLRDSMTSIGMWIGWMGIYRWFIGDLRVLFACIVLGCLLPELYRVCLFLLFPYLFLSFVFDSGKTYWILHLVQYVMLGCVWMQLSAIDIPLLNVHWNVPLSPLSPTPLIHTPSPFLDTPLYLLPNVTQSPTPKRKFPPTIRHN